MLLRARGFDVLLVDHGRLHASGPYESLLAPARTLLARTGLARLVEPAAEIDPLRHGALWGSDELVWRDGGEPGLLLRRGAFDASLRARARADGVRVLLPATARRDDTAERWFVTDAHGVEHPCRPHLVIVATGRTTASPAGATTTAPRTFAFGCVGEPAAADRGTAVVEATAHGWLWTHAPTTGPACATVLLDGAQLQSLGRERLLAHVLGAARGPAGRLRAPRVRHATDATPRLRTSGPDVLAIGDAANTIDPLASQGVEKALAAADHAAAVATTALQRSEWRERLFAAHARWERGLHVAHATVASTWYERETRFAAEPFWVARRQGAPALVASPASGAPLRVATNVLRAEVLVREGPQFVARAGAIDATTGDELSHIGYVPVLPVLDAFTTPRPLPAAVAVAGQDPRLFVLPPRAVHGAMLELLRRGWLSAAGNAADNR